MEVAKALKNFEFDGEAVADSFTTLKADFAKFMRVFLKVSDDAPNPEPHVLKNYLLKWAKHIILNMDDASKDFLDFHVTDAGKLHKLRGTINWNMWKLSNMCEDNTTVGKIILETPRNELPERLDIYGGQHAAFCGALDMMHTVYIHKFTHWTDDPAVSPNQPRNKHYKKLAKLLKTAEDPTYGEFAAYVLTDLPRDQLIKDSK